MNMMLYYMSKISALSNLFMTRIVYNLYDLELIEKTLILQRCEEISIYKGGHDMEIGIIIMLIILLSIVLTIVMLKSVNNDGSTLPKYDERQKIQRGRGYMFAFYSTLIIYCAIPFVTTESSRKFFNQFLFTGPALIGILIHVSYCIWHNAYVQLNSEFKKCLSIILSTSIFNLLLGYTAIHNNKLVKDDQLQLNVLNLAVGSLGIIIVLEMIIKRIIDKRGEANEESEA